MGVFNSLVSVDSGVSFVSEGSSKILGMAFCSITDDCIFSVRIVPFGKSFGNHELIMHKCEVLKGNTKVFSDLTLNLNNGDMITVESYKGKMSVNISTSTINTLKVIQDGDRCDMHGVVNKKTYIIDGKLVTIHFDQVTYGICPVVKHVLLRPEELWDIVNDDMGFNISLNYYTKEYLKKLRSSAGVSDMEYKLAKGRNLATSENLVFDWLQDEFYENDIETKWYLPISFGEEV